MEVRAALVVLLVAGVVLVLRETVGKPATITAYFTSATAIYPGDDVRVAGVKVGSITAIQPHGTKARMTLAVDRGVPVPADARAAIGAKVRECWTRDAGALGADQMQVILQVTVDANGVARRADIGTEDQGKLSDPVFRAFAERARRAVLDAHCNPFPLPPNLMGQVQVLKFRFSP